MLVKYHFEKETLEIEVSEEWANVIIELDRLEYNNDHKEKRRHCSLDALNLDETLLPSKENVEADVVRKEESKMLEEAISRLKPHQQALIRAVYFDEIPMTEYATYLGITKSAVTQQKDTAIKKLKKLLQKT